ncbi:cobyrinate a,c-diamide synthase [Butyrivibrio sp. JL13D10]|uniref:cobyrinate a,c-diamide synthase n=1 Tax=Butyrivibrio sp. JL13D10 TaxID=3236815 RepID=UPI0038B5A364
MKKRGKIPGIIIAAPGSGSGKTLITCAILQMLKRQQFNPASFKCGPDYIDPMFHKKVLGLPSRNLDVFLAGEEGVMHTLKKGTAGRDLAVAEGVMGFFDGISATSYKGSSYDISVITDIPVILVVNARGMSRSVIPLIKGFVEYGNKSRIKGVILNNISDKVADRIKDLILEETGVPVIGHLPKLKDVSFESRHLGLLMPDEICDVLKKIDKAADELEKRADFDKLISIIFGDKTAKAKEDKAKEDIKAVSTRVGIAMDEAFCFYYEDNLDLLREMGAEPVFFSPIHDKSIPDVSRLIFGGGYPEIYAEELSQNLSMRESIKNAAIGGMPMLAECGGFLYLMEKLSGADGIVYDMVDIFDGRGYMTSSLKHFGYAEVTALKDNPYLMQGELIKGHEFHYCDTDYNGDIFEIKKPVGDVSWQGYRLEKNVLGGFTHLYYPSCPEFIKRFLEA